MTEEQKQIVLNHVYSFVKTYCTVFIGIFLFGFEQKEQVFGLTFLIADAQVSFVSVLRTAYKLLTEK